MADSLLLLADCIPGPQRLHVVGTQDHIERFAVFLHPLDDLLFGVLTHFVRSQLFRRFLRFFLSFALYDFLIFFRIRLFFVIREHIDRKIQFPDNAERIPVYFVAGFIFPCVENNKSDIVILALIQFLKPRRVDQVRSLLRCLFISAAHI